MVDAGFIRGVKNAIYVVHVCPLKVGRANDPWQRWIALMYTWPFEHDIKVLALVPGMQYRRGAHPRGMVRAIRRASHSHRQAIRIGATGSGVAGLRRGRERLCPP